MPPPARLTFRTARHPATAECTELECLFRARIGSTFRTATDTAVANRLFNPNASTLGPVAVPMLKAASTTRARQGKGQSAIIT